jgi:hypothetical protein
MNHKSGEDWDGEREAHTFPGLSFRMKLRKDCPTFHCVFLVIPPPLVIVASFKISGPTAGPTACPSGVGT